VRAVPLGGRLFQTAMASRQWRWLAVLLALALLAAVAVAPVRADQGTLLRARGSRRRQLLTVAFVRSRGQHGAADAAGAGEAAGRRTVPVYVDDEDDVDEPAGEEAPAGGARPPVPVVPNRPTRTPPPRLEPRKALTHGSVSPQTPRLVAWSPPAPPLLSSFQLSNYYIEVGIIALFAAYGVNYFVGRNKNREIVTRWCAAPAACP